MRILQHNLNHCEAAYDLLTQLVREMKIDLVIIADPYTRPKTQAWITDVTRKAAIWSCNRRPFEDQPDSTQRGFVRAKLGGVHFYSIYAPPSLNSSEFTDLLDRLVRDAPGQATGEARKQMKEEMKRFRQCLSWTWSS